MRRNTEEFGACPPGYGVSTVPGKKFTAIPFSFSSVASNGTSTQRYTLSTGFHFVCMQINGHGSSNRNFTVLIKDEYMSQDLTKDPVHAEDMCGSGERPYNMPIPYRFLGGTTISIQVKNLHTAAQDIYVTLIGYEEPSGK